MDGLIMDDIINALKCALSDLQAIDDNGSHGRTIDLILGALESANTRAILSSEYLDWVNNYISPSVFGEHRGLTEDQAHQLIKLGRAIFESKHPDA
jgi:hypothetical protein